MLFSIVVLFLVFYFFVYPKSKWEASVSLFTGMIVLNSVLGDENQVWIIDHRVLATMIVIYSAYFYKVITVKRQKFDTYKNITMFLTLFLFIVVSRHIDFKTDFINNRLDYQDQIKRLFRNLVYAYAIYVIIKRMYDKRTLSGIENGILLGLGLAIISMLYYDFFTSMGFSLHTGDSKNRELVYRQTGFLGDNPNNASALFNTVIGYLYAKNEKRNAFSKKHIVMLLFALIGVLVVASRAGLVVLSIITLVYIYRSTSNIKGIVGKSIVVLLIGFIGFHFFGDYMMHRVSEYQTGEDNTLNTRQRYWLIYLNDIIQNPEYLIIGNLGKPTYGRDVHNTYIQYLFYAGIIALSIIIYNFWKIFKYRNKYSNNEGYFSPLYMLIVLMVSWSTGAGTFNFWFILLLAASSGIPKKIKSYNEKSLIE